MQRDGLLKESELAGGKTGTNMRYSMASVRGDVVRFVDGTEAEGCYNIGLLKEFSDQVVVRVQERVPGLQAQVIQRGKLMCTCYPGDALDDKPCGQGGPCRYVRHCDNPDKNGRVLTALYYLNSHWVPSHGGCLRIYPSDAAGQSLSAPVDIEPVLDADGNRVTGEFWCTTDNGFGNSANSWDYPLHIHKMKIQKPFTFRHGESTFDRYTETESLGVSLLHDPNGLIGWENGADIQMAALEV